MTKLRNAQDFHPYLVQGYEILDESGAETRFSTYQLHPRAETLFREAGKLKDGTTIDKPEFYALFLDGNIYTEAMPDGIPIVSVPSSICSLAQTLFSSNFFEMVIPGEDIPRGKYTLDYYRYFMETRSKNLFFSENEIDHRRLALRLASNYTIYLHTTVPPREL
jgi:hypothetical protein